MSPEARERSFDDLARGLANGSISRRKAIKFISAITLGGILGLSGIGTAFAKNKTCAQWCAAVFGANTLAAGRCTSDAAHGTGLCSSCGTATLPSSVCCTRNSSDNCTSYSGASCCRSGQTCVNGSCCANANACGSTCLAAPCDSSQCLTCDSSTGTCVGCPSGKTCLNGSCCKPNFTEESICVADSECCSGACVHSDPTDPTSGGCLPCHCPNETSGCFCRNRADVTGSVCIDFSQNVPLPFTVVSCAECPDDRVCFFRAAGGGMLVKACGYTC